MKQTLAATVLFCFLSTGIALGCDCTTNVSHRFMDNINNYSFVAMVEVLRKDTVRGKERGGLASAAFSHIYTFTVVKIIKQYSGKLLEKEVKIFDPKGFECLNRLHYMHTGDRFIVKGGITDINEQVFTDWDKPLPKEYILLLGLCDTHQLSVDKDQVTGQVTAHRSFRRWRRSIFFRKISFGLIDTEEKVIKTYVPQQMGIEAFEGLLSRRLKKHH